MATERKTIQQLSEGVSDYVARQADGTTYKNFSYFLGGIDATNQNLDQFTPYIRGVSRIFVHKLPPFMTYGFKEMSESFKTYVETGYKQVDGIGDISVDFTTFEGGFNGQQFSTPQSARDDTESVTISVYELRGSPIREYLDTWVTGVRDPRSGIAHYHGMIEEWLHDKKNGKSYSEKNHTAEFVYTTYDPTGLILEYSCLFAHCFPRRVPKSHLNYEAGNRDNVQIEMEFATTKYESPAINDIGLWYTMNSKVRWNYLDFDPEAGEGSMKQYGVVTYDYGNVTGTDTDGTPIVQDHKFGPKTRMTSALAKDNPHIPDNKGGFTEKKKTSST